MHRPSIRLLAAAAVLGVAACTPSSGSQPGGAATSAPTGAVTAAASADASADATATIKVLDFKLDPGAYDVTGSTVALAVTNAGPTVHNVTVRDAAGNVLFGTSDLREGQAETVTHTLAPGTYILFCSLPGHESLGIKGTLTVTAP